MSIETVKQPHEIIESLRPFLLSYHGPAGSQFILSLFDGHSQILMLPGYVNLISLFDKKLLSIDHAFELFYNANPYFFDTSKMTAATPNHAGFFFLGENQDEGFSTSRPDFIRYYRDYMQGLVVDTRNVINALYYAFARTHNMDLLQKKVILFHPYSHYMAIKYHRIFPCSKSLVPVRHPINGYVWRRETSSLRSQELGLRNDHFYRLLWNSLHVFQLLKNNIEIIIWRIEDLNQKPKEVLSQLCRFMGIDCEPCLEKSTVMGKKYWGHSRHPEERIYNFSPSLHQYIRSDELNRAEKVMLVTLNKRLNKILNYEMPELTFLEKYFSLFFFLMLTKPDIDWLRRNRTQYRIFIKGFLEERLGLIRLLFKNMIAQKEHSIIKKSFIET